MSETNLKSLVLEAIDNARVNGFDIDALSPEDLTDDLLDCDADISNLAAGPDGFNPQIRGEIIAVMRQ